MAKVKLNSANLQETATLVKQLVSDAASQAERETGVTFSSYIQNHFPLMQSNATSSAFSLNAGYRVNEPQASDSKQKQVADRKSR